MSKKFNCLVQLHWTATEADRYAITQLIAPILEERFPNQGKVLCIDMADGTSMIGFFTEGGVIK